MYALAIHGGAGSLDDRQLTAKEENLYRKGLDAALLAGYKLLTDGGCALDAAQAAVEALEDNPLFNAGKGSVFNYEGQQRMDAAVMCGSTLAVGAVAGVNRVRNPVALARRILQHPDLAFIEGEGALQFAHSVGIGMAEPEYFQTEDRFCEWRESRLKQVKRASDTVGAVALDSQGNLAAASSTGGITNKRFGRVGDTPVIGAGTYANNDSCAVCCTGDGEFFIRLVTAYDVAAMVKYGKQSLALASQQAIKKLTNMGGLGGLIAITPLGEIELQSNCDSMPRAWISSEGIKHVRIWMNS